MRVLSAVNQKKKSDVHPAVLRLFAHLKWQEQKKKLVKYGVMATTAATVAAAIAYYFGWFSGNNFAATQKK